MTKTEFSTRAGEEAFAKRARLRPARRVTTSDGVALHVEVTGEGPPLLFCHEYAGDVRSWDLQVAELSRTRTCIAYSARGYLPSDVPTDEAAYSQARAVADAVAVLDALDISVVDVVGLSMGGYTALNVLAEHPDRVRAVVTAGCGFGSLPEQRDSFVAECDRFAAAVLEQGMESIAPGYANGPSRRRLRDKDEQAWRTFAEQLGQHSTEGSALICLGVQKRRPTLPELIPALVAADRPLLIVTGDEDEGCIGANALLKQQLPNAGWMVLPRTGHTVNLEEPTRFSEIVSEFLHTVEENRWTPRPAGSSGSAFSHVGNGN